MLAASWTYDALGRTTLKEVVDPSGGIDTYTWEWDTAWKGARTRATDPMGEMEYAYADGPWGGFGAVTQVTRRWTDGTPDTVKQYQYDFEGREISTTWPSGAVVDSTYSATGWLTGQLVSWDAGGVPRAAEVFHAYDGWGLSDGWYGGELGVNANIDADYTRGVPSRLSRVEWFGGMHSVDWTWSPSGLLMRKQIDGLMEGFDYTYDPQKRITGVFYSGIELEGYAYDATGVMLERRHEDDGVSTYAAPWAFHEVPSFTTGNRSQAFTWDPITGRLNTRQVSVGGVVTSTIDYSYDGAGRLASIEGVYGTGPGATWLHYDVDDTLVLEERYEAGADETYHRFDGWRKKEVVGQPTEVIENVLPMLKLVNDEARWTLMEPEGHTLRTYRYNVAVGWEQLSHEIAGVYGNPLPRSESAAVYASGDWEIEGLHGLEPDRVHGVVHAGARHFLARDGMWLQPEPLLHLGIHSGDLSHPLAFGPVYAMGNTNWLRDPEGRHPVLALGLAVAVGYYALVPNVANAPTATDTATTPDQTANIMIGAATAGATVADGAALAGVARAGLKNVGKALTQLGKGAANPCKCFVADIEVTTTAGNIAIDRIGIGDRVIAAAFTDGGEEPWVEVASAPAAKASAWAPRGLCEQVKRWARTAVVPAVMLAACDVAELPAADEVVQVYDVRTGDWFEAVGAELEVRDTYVDDGRVIRVTDDGVEVRGQAAREDLAEADATWVAEAAHRVPGGDDWVLVLGDSDEAGHWRLSEVVPGERFAFQGRVFETADVDADGDVEVRATGDVLGRVVDTFKRRSDVVIDLVVSGPGGSETITGTPEHPFWVPVVGDYVAMGDLEVGTTLRTASGGEARVDSVEWREGDFEVFNFEVEGIHNYFVRAPGSNGDGVLVHNACVQHFDNFDAARTDAFQRAGMTDGNVEFAKFDPKTGTAVEFKGEGGAKVAYDGPHADGNAAAGHDKPHVGWQSGGKRSSGGAQRGNNTYDGPQHPSRPDTKGNFIERLTAPDQKD